MFYFLKRDELVKMQTQELFEWVRPMADRAQWSLFDNDPESNLDEGTAILEFHMLSLTASVCSM